MEKLSSLTISNLDNIEHMFYFVKGSNLLIHGFLKARKNIRFDVTARGRFLATPVLSEVEGKLSHTKIDGDCFGTCPRNDT